MGDLRLYEYYTQGKLNRRYCKVLGEFTSVSEGSDAATKLHAELRQGGADQGGRRHVGVALRGDNGGVLFEAPPDFLASFYD